MSTLGVARAKPEAPRAFCDTYPDSPHCAGKVPDCQFCHLSTFPAEWNSFGLALQVALAHQGSFEQELPAALKAVQSSDADGDGASNLDEIDEGTLPGVASSAPADGVIDESAEPNPNYSIGQYDLAYAYKSAIITYCGHSPSYEELVAFRDATDARALLHQRVSECLRSEYWRNEGLVRLADDRIRPIVNLGQDSRVAITLPISSLSGELKLRSTMGDYRYDYRLWVHVLTEDRNARELLLAQYFVKDDGQVTDDIIPADDMTATASGQLLQKPYRAGMLTTMWFLARNTMFSALPRTTAAAAYRGYLGADISKLQGLLPVANEPDDIDDKGVDNPRCAVCHSTLDPLSYAFAPYMGLDFNIDIFFLGNLLLAGKLDSKFGTFDQARAARRMPRWSPAEQQSVVLGQPVKDLREWAQVAADSDEFARNLANIFFTHALSREPSGLDLAEFTALWQSLPADGYSANKLIHRLVDSHAFGAP